ncbi:MAG: Major facilitator superfamily domain-containing protein 10 Tetracycline transporter-like protein [Candidatus Peregrinibacteria bacterium Gr01-1014_25]|nr:MAG: Major facilitator superfamily domain-containing protein 10 Tetracycline transporter-like protein [Candidatus Peregrinibacteria bacterium Gr01-1014_25]
MRAVSHNAVLGTLFLTAFLDLVGFGIVIPLMAPLLLAADSPLFSGDVSTETRTIAYGLLLAAYPAAQFFGAPILGALADRHGRKPVLLASLTGTCVGYALSAVAIGIGSLPLLFASRLLDGFTGGNISVAQSAIADISAPEEKTRNFGLIGMAFGLGFILGPFLGGLFADPTIHPTFTTATPFWVAALLSLLTVFSIIFLLPETLRDRVRSPLSWLTGVRNIQSAFRLPHLRAIFVVAFILALGFTFFTQFFQVLLVDRFAFTERQIGLMFAYVGLWIAIVQGGVTRPASRIATPTQIVRVSTLLLGIALPLLLLPTQYPALLVILPLIALAQGLTHPNILAIVSNLSGSESQGEALGIMQSLNSAAMAIPPVIAGFLAALDPQLPIIVASLCTFAGWALFVFLFRTPPTKREVFHEM